MYLSVDFLLFQQLKMARCNYIYNMTGKYQYICFSFCSCCVIKHLKHKTNKLRGHSSPENYTERATAAFADRKCCVVSTTDLHGRFLGFIDRSRYYFFKVAPELYSPG
jgi:hypothetical protein